MTKIFKKVIEYFLVLCLLLVLCFYINRELVLKALYMDDLFHWSWFRGLNLFEFAFKFYETSRYRPVFDTLQYIFYVIVDTDPTRLSIINKIYNSIVAVFIYHFAKRLNVGRMIALMVSSLYILSHYAYYQVSQGIGSLETTSLLLSLIILFYCLKLTSIISSKDQFSEDVFLENKYKIRYTLVLFILFFLVVFTHERYIGTALPIVIAIIGSKDEKLISRRKIVSLIVFAFEILLICFIRYMAIGKVIPAGTGGTYVEETFSINQLISFCFIQVAFIFGINLGPEYLYGIGFFDIVNVKVKYLLIASIVLIIMIVILYIVFRFWVKSKKNNLLADLLFLSFIAVCIGSSSVTIRVELRFIYVSFTAAMIYLSYMSSFIMNNIDNRFVKLIPLSLTILVLITRLPIELEYRKYYNKIHCIVDTIRVNSIYDNTIKKYGLDDILNNKKIFVINKYYGMTNFYAEYILKIYDKNNVGNTMILVNDFDEIPASDINENTIVLYENLNDNNYASLY